MWERRISKSLKKQDIEFNSTENEKCPKNSTLYLLFNDVNSSNYSVANASLITFAVLDVFLTVHHELIKYFQSRSRAVYH